MRRAAAAACGALLLPCAAPAQGKDECAHDREAMLALPYAAFDQDQTQGWRPLANHPECRDEAADLIAAYRTAHAGELDESNARTLRWHEGQMRAVAGQTEAALPLFRSTLGNGDINDAYGEATIAFLEQDRAALTAAREKLAVIPEPPDFAAGVARAREQYGDDYADSISWPLNLDVVDGFIACFDEPYEVAYSNTCRPD